MTAQSPRFTLTKDMMEMIYHIDFNLHKILQSWDLHGFRESEGFRHQPRTQRIELLENGAKVRVVAGKVGRADNQCIILKNLRAGSATLLSASGLSDASGASSEPVFANEWVLNMTEKGIACGRKQTFETEIETRTQIAVSAELGMRVWAEMSAGVSFPVGFSATASAGVEISARLGLSTEFSRAKVEKLASEFEMSTDDFSPRLFSDEGNIIYATRSVIKRKKQQTFTYLVPLLCDVEVHSTGKEEKFDEKDFKGWLQPLKTTPEGKDIDGIWRSQSHKWVDTEGGSITGFFDGYGTHAHSPREAIAQGEKVVQGEAYEEGKAALLDVSKASFQQTDVVVFDQATLDSILVENQTGRKKRLAKEAAQKARQG